MWSSLLKVNIAAFGTPRRGQYDGCQQHVQFALTSLWLNLDLLLAFSEDEGLVSCVLVSACVDLGANIAVDAWISVGGIMIVDVQFVPAVDRIHPITAIEDRHRVSRHGGGSA